MAPSFALIRSAFIYPLYVHHPGASGDVAYVMADGSAYFERLHAASDLIHLGRVQKILILNETDSAGFHFTKQRSCTRSERAVDYLGLWGVPAASVIAIDRADDTRFGSLSEARQVAKRFPDLSSLVVVTSAPHTRRSYLAFQRSMPSATRVEVYAASPPIESAELWLPIWVEYSKLVIYFFVS
ncbi:YdcF family protein [Rubripirellula lacrimiformis]|uniref:YdcF family protein n=1 Tax=Rubripirellula lacrimiformis TaxID=1930273 RepID=UPI001FE7DB61|nr:ElyC/SanA/YdcF family protein [Rubripirellula lacrimiformis]